VNERNFKIEIFLAVAVCISGFALRISSIEWLVILINIGFVLSAELVNTAIEKLCDVTTKEMNPIIKIIKDVAAAAVLLAAITAFICALIIFIPPIFKLILQ
ncbi:MAG: diacylglycerol kinase family protein, partial [Ferruginibacter sp.]|nr:diacylglycerol kinase family protein [Ferruginibacter sp.]